MALVTAPANATGDGAHDAPFSVAAQFWDHGGDGRAEIATYDLTYPRFGELRSGVAITIFVTETFAETARVETEAGRHPQERESPILKLNLMVDFPSGIYDYNLMNGGFVGITPCGERPAGVAARSVFSSREWCGAAFIEMLARKAGTHNLSHSYFEGEGAKIFCCPTPKSYLSSRKTPCSSGRAALTRPSSPW